MKIIVQHQAAVESESDAHPEQTCVWIVGDDGETLPYSESNPTDGEGTAYLKAGQEVTIEIATEVKGSEDEGQVVTPTATMCDVVGEVKAPVEPEVDRKEGQRPGEDLTGDDDTSVLR